MVNLRMIQTLEAVLPSRSFSFDGSKYKNHCKYVCTEKKLKPKKSLITKYQFYITCFPFLSSFLNFVRIFSAKFKEKFILNYLFRMKGFFFNFCHNFFFTGSLLQAENVDKVTNKLDPYARPGSRLVAKAKSGSRHI